MRTAADTTEWGTAGTAQVGMSGEGHEERRLGEFFPAAGGEYSPTSKANLTLPCSISTYACTDKRTAS